MAERRDYYEILGVPRDADAQRIKSAFRELALRYHPDRSHEPGAEERFKEIAEAYSVLGDPEKRASYDARGFAGVSGARPEDLFTGVDLEDLFGGLGFEFGGLGGGLFDRLFGARPRGPQRGRNVEVDVEVPLETVAKGGEQRVSFRHPRACPDCPGSGAKAGTRPRPCEACRGTGEQTTSQQEENVLIHRVTTCPSCGGRGRFVDTPCEACHGVGRIADEESLNVRIPVGVRDGMALRIPGKGMPAPEGGGPPGDLYVVVRGRPDPRFARRGPDLWREEEIAIADAVLGTKLRVPTLDGHARLEVPPGTQPDTVLRLAGKGLPEFRERGHGDLYVALRLRVPEKLSREERKLWQRLRQLDGAGKP